MKTAPCVTSDETVDELAAHAALDKFHLVRAFRAEVGLPPYEYLTHLRVARARELLERGAIVAAAAQAVGFCDESQLHRHFRRIVGVAPGAYARSFAAVRTRQHRTRRAAVGDCMKTAPCVTSDEVAAGSASPEAAGSASPDAASDSLLRHYFAVAPDGTRLTRTTRHTYSHAVLVWCESWRDRAWKWRSYGFAGSVVLAAKLAEVRRKRLEPGERIEVVGVQEFSPLTPRQREFLDQIGDRTIEVFGASYLVALASRGLVERRFIGMRWWRVRRTAAGRKALEVLGPLGNQAGHAEP